MEKIDLSYQGNNTCLYKGPYYNHAIHLISFGSIWMIASFLSLFHYENLAIIFLFTGIGIFNPLYKVICNVLSLCPIPSDDPLRMMITCMTIGLPVGMLFCFLPFLENPNVFFNVFGILFGFVFLLVFYIYGLKRYAFLGGVLISCEFILLFVFDNFVVGGFFAGTALILFGIFIRLLGMINYDAKANKDGLTHLVIED
jgi:hypothetical protein